MSDCTHGNLDAACHVNTVTLPSGDVGARLMTVKVTCKDCGIGLWFPGCATGIDYRGPVTNTNGTALTVPLVPIGDRNVVDPSLVSVSVRTNDTMKGQR